MQEVVVHLCSGEQALISKQAVQAGCHSLLNTMGEEDVMGDAPKAADWVSAVLPVMLHSYSPKAQMVKRHKASSGLALYGRMGTYCWGLDVTNSANCAQE